MSTTVYLVRHAEAEGNIGRRCHGQYDSLLTQRGLQQAKMVGDRFRTIRLDAIYSSDLSRARHTALAIAQPKGMTVKENRNLREIDLGDWEDKPWEELKEFQSELYDCWCNRPWECQPPKGETIPQAGQRVFDEICTLAAQNNGKYIAVVTHGTVTRSVLALAQGLPQEQLMQVGWGDNTAVTRLVFLDDGTIRVDYKNDNSHLPPELSTFRSLKWSDTVDVPKSLQMWFKPVDWDDPEEKALTLELFHMIYWPTYGKEAYPDEKIEARLRGFQEVIPEAVSYGMIGKEHAGIIAMNTVENRDNEIGEMGGTGILPKFRGCGLGPQLMAHAVSTYRRMGKKVLQAKPLASRPAGPHYYMSNGFVPTGEMTEDGKFIILRRDIEVK